MLDDVRRKRSWSRKFGDAFRGIKRAARGQSSFFVHLFAAVAVVTTGVALQVDGNEWRALVLCITVVFVAETFNTALETLAKAVDREENPQLRDALDMSSGAVLLAAIGAAAVGLMVFAHRLSAMLFVGA